MCVPGGAAIEIVQLSATVDAVQPGVVGLKTIGAIFFLPTIPAIDSVARDRPTTPGEGAAVVIAIGGSAKIIVVPPEAGRRCVVVAAPDVPGGTNASFAAREHAAKMTVVQTAKRIAERLRNGSLPSTHQTGASPYAYAAAVRVPVGAKKARTNLTDF